MRSMSSEKDIKNIHRKSEFSKKDNFFWRLFSQKEFSESFPENEKNQKRVSANFI